MRFVLEPGTRNIGPSSMFPEVRHVANFIVGKTEATIQWAGRGSGKAKRDLAVSRSNKIVCSKHKGEPVSLRIVDAYRHLGTRTSISSNMSQEVVFRVMALRGEAKTLRNKTLANERIELQRRVAVAQTYVFAKGMYQASTWPELHGANFRKIHHAVMGVCRTVSRVHWEPDCNNTSDDAVIA